MRTRWKLAAGLASAGLSACAAAKEPAPMPGPAFPAFASAVQLRRDCDAQLAVAHARLKALDRQPPSRTWVARYDEFYASVEDAHAPVELISNVHPDRKVRNAAQACELRWQDFITIVGQDTALYRAAKASPATDDIDRQALRLAIETFEDAGAGLKASARKRARQLANRIGELGQHFDANLRDHPAQLTFSRGELTGVPEAVLAGAARDAQGRLLLGLDYPTYFAVVEHAWSAETRERMWRAKMNEGGRANLELLGEIARQRRDYARLLGFASYADFSLRREMAADTATVDRFLTEVAQAVSAGERQDLAALRDAKARHLGVPVDAVVLQRWDVPFYTERLRKERFSVDQESFRQYFPPEESLRFVMRMAETMFGIRFSSAGARLWHPDVQAFAVSDAATGEPMAALLVDLYPRDGKYGHAAVWPFRSGSVLAHRLPQAALVVNVSRQGLTLDELDTLLHEFGHALHACLSKTRYALDAGTSTRLDFVEAPSQMLEDWVFDRKVLALFREVCPPCRPVPDELIDKARAAREFTKSSLTARQVLYARFDQALHGPDAPEPMALWRQMEAATPLGYVPQTLFPAGFTHVAGNYGAGYYAYLWSLKLAMDLRTAFEPDRLSPEVGRRYRDTVLSQGGQRPPAELLRDFLGRETNASAFDDYLRR